MLTPLNSGCHKEKGSWGFTTNLLPEKKLPPHSEHPGYDEDGNLIVDPEIRWTYHMPDIHAGFTYDFKFRRARPVIGLELCEFKAPLIRWNQIGVFGGEDLVGVHLSHRWTSIFEVSTGVWYGYDTSEQQPTFGVALLIIKF